MAIVPNKAHFVALAASPIEGLVVMPSAVEHTGLIADGAR
jgi:hypothetical protein